MKRHSPLPAARALTLAAALSLGAIVAGSHHSGSPALAASRAGVALAAPKPTAMPVATKTSSSATSNPGPAGAVSPGLPPTGGAPGRAPQPAWPLALLGLLAAGTGIAVRRFSKI